MGGEGDRHRGGVDARCDEQIGTRPHEREAELAQRRRLQVRVDQPAHGKLEAGIRHQTHALTRFRCQTTEGSLRDFEHQGVAQVGRGFQERAHFAEAAFRFQRCRSQRCDETHRLSHAPHRAQHPRGGVERLAFHERCKAVRLQRVQQRRLLHPPRRHAVAVLAQPHDRLVEHGATLRQGKDGHQVEGEPVAADPFAPGMGRVAVGFRNGLARAGPGHRDDGRGAPLRRDRSPLFGRGPGNRLGSGTGSGSGRRRLCLSGRRRLFVDGGPWPCARGCSGHRHGTGDRRRRARGRGARARTEGGRLHDGDFRDVLLDPVEAGAELGAQGGVLMVHRAHALGDLVGRRAARALHERGEVVHAPPDLGLVARQFERLVLQQLHVAAHLHHELHRDHGGEQDERDQRHRSPVHAQRKCQKGDEKRHHREYQGGEEALHPAFHGGSPLRSPPSSSCPPLGTFIGR